MTRHLALLLIATLLASPSASAQPATQPADAADKTVSSISRSLDLAGPGTTLDDIERAIDLALTPDGQPVDLDNLDPLHRAAAAASRIASSPVSPADRQRAAELEALSYNALANAAQQRDRPTETGLRLMQARTAAETLTRQGPDPARQAGAWWRMNADLADANRLSRGPFPSPRAHRDAIDALERYLDATGDKLSRQGQTPAIDDARGRAARLMLFELYRDTGNADEARRIADSLLEDAALPDTARLSLAQAQPWLDAPGQRVPLPTAWESPPPRDSDAAMQPATAPNPPSAWVVEADPSLPLTKAVARALATGDYPAIALHTVYVGDPAALPEPIDESHGLHRLTAAADQRQALNEMAVDRVPAVVVLNGSSRLVASGHAPAVLDRLLLAP